jgi:Putative beta-barrel porin-2, OmpL-like. bbp2
MELLTAVNIYRPGRERGFTDDVNGALRCSHNRLPPLSQHVQNARAKYGVTRCLNKHDRGASSKKSFWSRFPFVKLKLFIFSFGILCPQAHSQMGPLPPMNLGKGVQLSGTLDNYYSWNMNAPVDHLNALHNFDAYNSSLRLNLVELGLTKDPDPIGFEIDGGAGDLYKLIDAGEPDSPLRNFLQMFVSYKFKALHALQVDFGKFQTSAGIESAETLSGWNYSRSLLFVYAQPNYHFGLRSDMPLGAHVKVGLQLVNGWNHTVDGNGWRTVAATSELTFKRWSLYQDYYYGPENTGGAFRPRGLYDVTFITNTTSDLKLDVNIDVGYQRTSAATATWRGLAVSLQWSPSARIGISPRYEWFYDVEGFTTGSPQQLQEVTLTGDYNLIRGLVARAEFRMDHADKGVFPRGVGMTPGQLQPTVLLSLIASFGSLGR